MSSENAPDKRDSLAAAEAKEERDYGATAQPDGAAEGSLEAQDGVKAIEGVSMAWTKWGLVVAYIR